MRTTRSLPLTAAAIALTLAGGQAAQAGPPGIGSPPPAAQRHTDARTARSPEGAAAKLVDAWVRGDRAAGRDLAASEQVVDVLFAAPAPERPRPLECRRTPHGTVCTHGLRGRTRAGARDAGTTAPDAVTLQVEAGGRGGYQVTAVDFTG